MHAAIHGKEKTQKLKILKQPISERVLNVLTTSALWSIKTSRISLKKADFPYLHDEFYTQSNKLKLDHF